MIDRKLYNKLLKLAAAAPSEPVVQSNTPEPVVRSKNDDDHTGLEVGTLSGLAGGYFWDRAANRKQRVLRSKIRQQLNGMVAQPRYDRLMSKLRAAEGDVGAHFFTYSPGIQNTEAAVGYRGYKGAGMSPRAAYKKMYGTLRSGHLPYPGLEKYPSRTPAEFRNYLRAPDARMSASDRAWNKYFLRKGQKGLGLSGAKPVGFRPNRLKSFGRVAGLAALGGILGNAVDISRNKFV